MCRGNASGKMEYAGLAGCSAIGVLGLQDAERGMGREPCHVVGRAILSEGREDDRLGVDRGEKPV